MPANHTKPSAAADSICTFGGIFMKQNYVIDLKVDAEYIDFFMLKSIEIKIGSNKKQYLDIIVGDSTGEISGKKWDLADEEIPYLESLKIGEFVKIKGLITEWKTMRQIRISKIRRAGADDGLELSDFIRTAPEASEDMFAYLEQRAQLIKDSDLRKLSLRLLNDNKERLMYYPAAQRNHHAERGGLLYHIKRMLMSGDKLCEIYTNLNADLVATGVIMHDMEKLNEIVANELGIADGYSTEGKLLGHIIMGVSSIGDLCRELEIPQEKTLMLQHMVLSHHYEPEFGSPKKPMFPEAELLHYLDILDAKMYDMEYALKAVDTGEFTERIRSMDGRMLYKSSFNLTGANESLSANSLKNGGVDEDEYESQD